MRGANAATVLVTSRTFGSGAADPEQRLTEAGLTVTRGSSDHDPDRLRAPLSQAVAWIAGLGPVGEIHLAAAPRLRVVARYGVGVDAVDLAAAARRRVVVTNTPGANSAAVAEHTLALILASLRRLLPAHEALRSGRYTAPRGSDLATNSLGLLGFGQVGREVARRARCLGANVLACDPYVPADDMAAAGVRPVSDAHSVAANSRIVSLHLPGGQRVVDRTFLDHMPSAAVLVNTARAELVDEEAVADALREGRLAALGCDVLDTDSVLLDAPNVLATPHIAGQTDTAVDRMGAMAVDNVLAVLADRQPPHPVHANPLPADRRRPAVGRDRGTEPGKG